MNNSNVPQDDEFIELLKEKKPNILVITEDWCGDAMMNNPILAKNCGSSGSWMFVQFTVMQIRT